MSWQPIETAPKDETTILICRVHAPGWVFYNVAYWNDSDMGTPEHPWCFADCGGRCGANKAWPTHWAPLDPPS